MPVCVYLYSFTGIILICYRFSHGGERVVYLSFVFRFACVVPFLLQCHQNLNVYFLLYWGRGPSH